MQQPPGDPRYGQSRHPHLAQPYATFGQQPSQSSPPSAAPGAQPMAGFAGNAVRFNVPPGLAAGLPKVQPKGLPSVLAFFLGLIGVAVALAFDVVFLKVHIPGAGGYAWYLTTALAFGGAGYGGAKWTRAGRGLALTAAVFAAVVYGVLDIGLGMVLEDLPMGGAIVLAAQGLAIALFTGCGGVYRGLRAKDEEDDE